MRHVSVRDWWGDQDQVRRRFDIRPLGFRLRRVLGVSSPDGWDAIWV